MRSLLPFATMCGTLLTMSAAAPAQLHSPQVTLHRAEKADDLSWTWSYAGEGRGEEKKLVQDPRFKPLLARALTAPQSFWGAGKPLAEVAAEFLSGPDGVLLADGNRYVTAEGCVAEFCADRGLLWIDLGLPRPLVVFAATDWISDNKTTDQADAAYTMWVFSNRTLNTDHMPPALRHSIERWTAKPGIGQPTLKNITRVFVVDPDGTPHAVSPTMTGAHNSLPAETTSEVKSQP